MSSNPQGTTGRFNGWKTTFSQLFIREGFNARKDMGDLEALSKSIATNGVERALNVIRNDDGKFEVIDGHRRYAAIAMGVANKTIPEDAVIPILIAEKGLTELERVAMMARANDGKPLLAIEEAALFKRLLDGGMKVAQVCDAVGRGQIYVRKHLDLLEAPQEVRDAMAEGKISKTLAMNISNEARKGRIDAKALVAQAVTGDKEVKRTVAEKVDKHAAKQRAIKVKLAAIQDTLGETSAKLKALMEQLGLSRAELKEKLGVKYEAVRLIGQEAALRALVNEHKED